MAPGPVPIHEKVLRVLSNPTIHHRTDKFRNIFSSCLKKLKIVFQTEQPVFIVPGTGSAAMESALVNTLSEGDPILCIINGKFAERWYDMATAYKLNAEKFEVHHEETFNIETFKKLNLKKYKAVLCQAVETSTGNLFPIEDIGTVIKKQNPQCLFMVDGITAVGVSHISMKIPSIDVLVSGSQKSFMLPAGLSFICLSPLAWESAQQATLPNYYFDLAEELKHNKKKQSRFSSLVNHTYALDMVLDEFINDKLDARIKYCSESAAQFREALKELNISLFSTMPAPSLTVIKVPDNIDGLKLKNDLEQLHHIIVAGGQDQLKGKIIRFGHMGYITIDNYKTTLTALQKSLQAQDPKYNETLLAQSLSVYSKNPIADYHDYFNY